MGSFKRTALRNVRRPDLKAKKKAETIKQKDEVKEFMAMIASMIETESLKPKPDVFLVKAEQDTVAQTNVQAT